MLFTSRMAAIVARCWALKVGEVFWLSSFVLEFCHGSRQKPQSIRLAQIDRQEPETDQRLGFVNRLVGGLYSFLA